MYPLLITFFLSLLLLILMIGSKLAVVEAHDMEMDIPHPLAPGFQKIKELTNKHTKKYGYAALVSVIRLHVKSSNFFKERYENIKAGIQNIHTKNEGEEKGVIKQEVSAFLRKMSDYKHKVRSITHKIKKEEENS